MKDATAKIMKMMPWASRAASACLKKRHQFYCRSNSGPAVFGLKTAGPLLNLQQNWWSKIMKNDVLGASGGLCVSEKTTPILQQI